MRYAARYEHACGLLKYHEQPEARDLFKALYTRTLDAGVLPPIDQNFRQTLRGDGRKLDQWTTWMQ